MSNITEKHLAQQQQRAWRDLKAGGRQYGRHL